MNAESDRRHIRRRNRSEKEKFSSLIPEVLANLQEVHALKKKAATPSRQLTQLVDRAIGNGMLLGERIGFDSLSSQAKIKFIAYAPLEDGKVAAVDPRAGYSIYAVFPKLIGSRGILTANSTSLARSMDMKEGLDELVNQVTLRPEGSFYKQARMLTTIRFGFDTKFKGRISQNELAVIQSARYKYIREFLEASKQLQEEFSLYPLYRMERGFLVMWSPVEKYSKRHVFDNNKPVFAKVPPLQPFRTPLDITVLQQLYQNYQDGDRSPDSENGATIYEILFLQGRKSVQEPEPTQVFVASVLPKTEEKSIIPQTDPLLEKVLTTQHQLEEAKVGKGDIPVGQLNQDKYITLLEWLRKSEQSEAGSWEIQTGAYRNDMSLKILNQDSDLVVPLDVAFLKKAQAKKGKSNFASEILKLLGLE